MGSARKMGAILINKYNMQKFCKLIYIMEGYIHNKDRRKMTCCGVAHLKTDDSQEEAPVTMISL
jgi:hypothetical protein